MKQSLQIGLGQNLAMTMQLQQAIGLLQLHSLELYQEIQNKLESNPFLELDDSYANSATNQTQALSSVATSDANPFERVDGIEPQKNLDFSEDIKVDFSSAEAGYDFASNWNSGSATDDREVWETTAGIPAQSLQQYLAWQLQLQNLSARDLQIAEFLIDSIDEDGFLLEPIAELHQSMAPQYKQLELDEVEAILHRIQRLDPVGVAAHDMREALDLQLENLNAHSRPAERAAIRLARQLVEHYLPRLAERDFGKLAQQLGVATAQIDAAYALIKSLNPKPGSAYAHSSTEYIVPDVFVKKVKSIWQVELNPDLVPKLNINKYYAGLVKRGDKSAEGNFMRDNLQEARFFIKSLQSRNETILKVANAILQRQRLFFEYGEEAMQPMVLKDIAEAIDMHESTVSRVTTQKYMHTPRGVYELKFFFSSSVATDDGGECSAIAIRALIKKLVENENPSKPLSDNKLTSELAAQGIVVARRTIAKYREALQIPSSSQRRI